MSKPASSGVRTAASRPSARPASPVRRSSTTIAIAAIPSPHTANSDVRGSSASDSFSVVSTWLTASPWPTACCSLVSVRSRKFTGRAPTHTDVRRDDCPFMASRSRQRAARGPSGQEGSTCNSWRRDWLLPEEPRCGRVGAFFTRVAPASRILRVEGENGARNRCGARRSLQARFSCRSVQSLLPPPQ